MLLLAGLLLCNSCIAARGEGCCNRSSLLLRWSGQRDKWSRVRCRGERQMALIKMALALYCFQFFISFSIRKTSGLVHLQLQLFLDFLQFSLSTLSPREWSRFQKILQSRVESPGPSSMDKSSQTYYMKHNNSIVFPQGKTKDCLWTLWLISSFHSPVISIKLTEFLCCFFSPLSYLGHEPSHSENPCPCRLLMSTAMVSRMTE